MNDKPDQPEEFIRIPLLPLPDKPLPHDEALAQVKIAVGNLVTAFRILEQAAWNSGWNKGSEWTMDQLKKFAQQTVAESAAKAGAADTPMAFAPEPQVSAAGRTAADIVYAYIKDYPGRTGVEIVRGLERLGLALQERTVRTALFRLKADKIAAVENRWYTTEKAREAAQARRERMEKELI